MFRKNKTKRSAQQNEMFFFEFPPHTKNASDFSGAFPFLHIASDIQVKPHVLIAIEQLVCTLYVVLIIVYIVEDLIVFVHCSNGIGMLFKRYSCIA